MASGKTLNATNLEALGAARLAALLIEVSTGSAVAQRRLRLALAGQGGAGETARMVTRRLTGIAGARTWLDWRKIKPLVTELEAQRRAVLELVAPSDPREAFELIWRLVGCAESVLGRSDDTGGRLAEAFHAAARDLGPLAQRAGIGTTELAERAARALSADRCGAWHELVPILAPPLGPDGLLALRALLQAWEAKPTSAVLQQVADALGDVDGFIGQFSERARRTPGVAAQIARRLLDAGRPQDARAALDAVDAGPRDQASAEWDEAWVAVLGALGRSEEAQAFRWARFLGTLDPGHLRAHLRALPDFDDFEAEERAMAHAAGFKDVHQALVFLVQWPDLRRADALVRDRARSLNGERYEVLSPAADALDGRYPLAATLLRRAMIGFALGAARSGRYRHAAAHLVACRAAAARVVDFGAHPDHATFERVLRAAHGRKAGFWQEADR